MPLVGFETTIPVSERAKTFHALDRAATVTAIAYNSSTSYMALQPIWGLGLLFMRFLNLTLIDSW
jgi:hypothetical protein